MSKLTPARALTAHVGRRMIRLATIIAFGVFGSVLLIAGLLAYFFSAWWWLLLLPFLFVLSIFFVIRLFALLVVTRLHSERMTNEQRTALDDFSSKIEALIEARATPWPIFVALSIKDLVIDRDITTIKKLIRDSTGLRRDYGDLEKLFN